MDENIGSFSFSYTYSDIMEGFAVLEKAQKDPRIKMLTLAMVGLLAYSFILMRTSFALFGIALAVISLYVIFVKNTLPVLRRKKIAKNMTQKEKAFVVKISQECIEIVENNNSFKLHYEYTRIVNSKNLLLLVSDGNLIVIPKRYFEQKNDDYVSFLKTKSKELFMDV